MEGTQSLSQIEMLWERYRSLVCVIVLGVIGALGLSYGWGRYQQGQIDQVWSEFAANTGFKSIYTDQTKAFESLSESLVGIDLATLESGLSKATESQKPYLLLAIARKCVAAKQWDRAESALAELEKSYPKHILVKSLEHPVQAQEPVKKDPKEKPTPGDKKPEWKPAMKGSAVSLVREQITAGKAYTAPAQFVRPEIPADAAKVKFELSGGYGSFVIALMPQAPLHREAILKLVETSFWKDIAVDEIRRGAKFRKRPMELHFGFESTKGDDREKWTATDPSKNLVDFEASNLSHYAGAVAARNEADGKSCADRLWISVDDTPNYDGDRVVVGYVIEGLDNLKKVCEASMTATEEEQGQGKPSDAIRIVAVSKL